MDLVDVSFAGALHRRLVPVDQQQVLHGALHHAGAQLPAAPMTRGPVRFRHAPRKLPRDFLALPDRRAACGHLASDCGMSLTIGPAARTAGNKGRSGNADRRFEPGTLSPDADLSRPAADHSRRLEDPRGGVRRIRQRPGQQRDVLLHAGPWRHPHRRAPAFRQERHADRRVPARILLCEGDLHRPAPHPAQGGDHALRPGGGRGEIRQRHPERGNGASVHRAS